jgi:DNA segregation ATPase FtsK/SpoIIIE-like protein
MAAARNASEYIGLVAKAEAKLEQAGIDPETRIHMLASVYYGAPWSKDFQVEHSAGRNILFGQWVDRPYLVSDDPRGIIGQALFKDLQASQDVGGIDMGHMFIGLDARMRASSRDGNAVGLQASGLDLVTWVGDLGAGTARFAFDRARGLNDVERYFHGTDYGAESNLEGDIAAYLVGSDKTNRLEAPALPSGRVAPALSSYFGDVKNWQSRKKHFFKILSSTVKGPGDGLPDRVASFAQLYYATRIVSDHVTQVRRLALGRGNIHDCSRQVTQRFLTWVNGSQPKTRAPARGGKKPLSELKPISARPQKGKTPAPTGAVGRLVLPPARRDYLAEARAILPPRATAAARAVSGPQPSRRDAFAILSQRVAQQTAQQVAQQAAQRAALISQQAAQQAQQAAQVAQQTAQRAQQAAQHAAQQGTAPAQQAARLAAQQATQAAQQAQQAQQAAQAAREAARQFADPAAQLAAQQAAQEAARQAAQEAARQAALQGAQQEAQRAAAEQAARNAATQGAYGWFLGIGPADPTWLNSFGPPPGPPPGLPPR